MLVLYSRKHTDTHICQIKSFIVHQKKKYYFFFFWCGEEYQPFLKCVRNCTAENDDYVEIFAYYFCFRKCVLLFGKEEDEEEDEEMDFSFHSFTHTNPPQIDIHTHTLVLSLFHINARRHTRTHTYTLSSPKAVIFFNFL